jgi:hypothetical protein
MRGSSPRNDRDERSDIRGTRPRIARNPLRTRGDYGVQSRIELVLLRPYGIGSTAVTARKQVPVRVETTLGITRNLCIPSRASPNSCCSALESA